MVFYKDPQKISRGLRIILGLIAIAYPQSAHAVTLLTQIQTANINLGFNINYNYSGFLKFDNRLGTLCAVKL